MKAGIYIFAGLVTLAAEIYCYLVDEYVAVLLLGIFTLFFTSRIYSAARMVKNSLKLQSFHHQPALGYYQETQSIFHDSRVKAPFGVLFLHGFSASTAEFSALIDALKKKDIPFYAPMLTGFGLDDLHLLKKVKQSDWPRDAVAAYDLLSDVANEVIVIGHSMGGLLACYLSQLRKVKYLVLLSPYLTPKKKHNVYKKIMRNSAMAETLMFFRPYIYKEGAGLDGERQRFAHDMIPSNAVRVMWSIQEQVDYRALQYEKMFLLYGSNDNTIEIRSILQVLTSSGIQPVATEFTKSGHNILEDVQREAVVGRIVDIIDGAENRFRRTRADFA